MDVCGNGSRAGTAAVAVGSVKFGVFERDWRSSSLHLMKPLVAVAVFQRYWRLLTGFCREQNGPKIVLAPQTRTSCMMWQKRDSNSPPAR